MLVPYALAALLCTGQPLSCSQIPIPFDDVIECKDFIRDLPSIPSVEKGDVVFIPLPGKNKIECVPVGVPVGLMRRE